MGILNFFGNVNDDRQTVAHGRVKGPCATLQDHGIDPAGLKFTLNQDGFVTVSGRARDESECKNICRIIEGMALVEGVRNNMVIESGVGTRFAGKVRLTG
jgi:hypothetical protein